MNNNEYATPEQIKTIKRLHYETGNIRAAHRPYVRMKYVNALREIEMLRKKLRGMSKPEKAVDPLAGYNKKQLRELAMIGEAYTRQQVDADSDDQTDETVRESSPKKTIIRKRSKS